MAQYTYNEPTNREDLTDVVTNISPTQTPITSMIGKSKANATYHEFPQDVLADAAANAHVEARKIWQLPLQHAREAATTRKS